MARIETGRFGGEQHGDDQPHTAPNCARFCTTIRFSRPCSLRLASYASINPIRRPTRAILKGQPCHHALGLTTLTATTLLWYRSPLARNAPVYMEVIYD